MNKYYIQLVLLLLLSLYLSHAHAGLFGGAKIEKNITYELMDSNLQIIDSLPIAQSNALLALDAAMRGIKSKKIKKSLNISIRGEQIDAIKKVISSLSIKNVVIDNIGGTAGVSSPFSGLIFMSDDIGRSVQISFVMLITNNSSGHDVQVINLSPSFFGAPNMDVFIVLDESVDASTGKTINDYSNLYKNISNKSLSVDTYPSGSKKYVAMVFFKSLIAPNVKVKVKLSSEKVGLDGNSEGNYFKVYEDGWIVAAKQFEGNLMQQKQWMKVTFQSDKSIYPAMSDEEYLVGLFKLGKGK